MEFVDYVVVKDKKYLLGPNKKYFFGEGRSLEVGGLDYYREVNGRKVPVYGVYFFTPNSRYLIHNSSIVPITINHYLKDLYGINAEPTSYYFKGWWKLHLNVHDNYKFVGMNL